MTHSETDTASRPASGHSALELADRPPAYVLRDPESICADLVAASAQVSDRLIVLLLFDPAAGGVRAAKVHHPDERRGVVLQARLTAELRALADPAGPSLPVDAEALPEPVRAVIAEEAGQAPAGEGPSADAAQVAPSHGLSTGPSQGPSLDVMGAVAGRALVVPVSGSLGPIGVLVLAQPGTALDGSALGGADVDRLIGLGEHFGHQLELARLAADSQRDTSLMAALPDAVIAVDERDLVTQWNPAAETLFQIAAGEAIGARLNDLVRTVFRDTDAHSAHARIRSEGSWTGRVRQTSRSGRVVECDLRLVPLDAPDGRARGRLGIYHEAVVATAGPRAADGTTARPGRPVPPHKNAQKSLRAAQPDDRPEGLAASAGATRSSGPAGMAHSLLEALDSPAAILDAAGTVVTGNARWLLAVGEAPRGGCAPVPAGRNWRQALVASPVHEAHVLGVGIARLLGTGEGVVRAECHCTAADRAPTVISVVPDGSGGALVVLQPPRTGPRLVPDELTFRATHDELTGLPNRAKLMDDLSSSLNRLDGTGKLAVLFCDLDGFKDINDGLGHDVGDQVLIAVAKRLRQRCRSADVVARFGGDEFVVVLSITEAAQAIAMADRIVEVLAEPIVVGEAEVAPGVSVGITVVDVPPDDDNPVGTLLRDADTAMYHAKGRGRGRYELFDASLRENIEERLELAAALHRAVADDQLEIVYQSRRHCGDRRVAGVEAMLRWRHPTLGLLEPDLFIPIAERTGRIVELGEWVLHHSLTDLAALDDPRITLAVNVSPRQLAGGRLARAVARSLSQTGIDPSRLTLEITESAFVDDPDVARTVLAELRELGVSIALDDFGTGWSSLQYLRTLPVDVLKIDRSFVADLPTNLDACAVVAAVLQLGHGMGLVVVAEGVENDDHLNVLRDMGCDEYQGFIDGRPGDLATVLLPTPPAAGDVLPTRR